MHELRERLDEPRRAALEAEGARVAEWLDAHPPDGLGTGNLCLHPRGVMGDVQSPRAGAQPAGL